MSIILRFSHQLLLIFLPLILVFIWFNNGLIIGKGEEGLNFYNLSKSAEQSKSIWVEVNTGMPNLSWLPRVPLFYLADFLNTKFLLPQFFIQAVLFFILMVTGVISVYYLTLSFLMNHPQDRIISLISSVFYLMNPFSMSQVWGRGLYPLYFSFALFPLSLLFLLYALNQRRYIYLIPLLFSSVLFSWSFGFVTTTICYWVVLGGYFIWWLFTNKSNKNNLFFGVSFFLLFFLGWIMVGAWWILPLITEGNKVLSSYLNNPAENLGTLIGVSRSYTLDVIVRLLHKGYFFDASAYSQIYSTLPFQLISFIPVCFVMIGLVKTLKNKELIRFRYFAVLFVLGLTVSLGANPPLGWLFVWIFETISPLQAFRNPFEKFGLVYTLGYVPLFAYGLVSSFKGKKLKKLILILVLFLICGIYAWPMWTGRILAGIDQKIGVKVPEYYEDLNIWLANNDPQNYRLFMTPLMSGEGAVFQWGNTTYNGVDPMHFILDRAAISNGAQIPFYYDFAQSIRKYMERENLAPALSLLRAKFLIDRKDAVKVSDREKDQVRTLTSVIHPPKGVESELRTICENKRASSELNNLAWIVCQIPQGEGDLSSIKYLHIKVKTNEPANLEVAVRDIKEVRIRWDGRKDLDYSTDTNDWRYITLPLSTPTEYNPAIDLSKVFMLEVLAHPKDKPLESVKEINVGGVKLDPGAQKEINEFKEVAQFDKLSVFELINFNPPPEFGTLSSINKVSDFAQLFEEVNNKRDQIDKKGFVLVSQNDQSSSPNNQKNLQDLTDEALIHVTDKYKISDTRYWVEVNHAQGIGLLLLSKTFNPEWKVIAGVGKEKLSGNFFDDLNLLKMAVLPEEKHFVVNGYANLWMIENKTSFPPNDGKTSSSLQNNQNQLAIVFLPQIYAEMGLKISVISTGILILIFGILSLKRVLK